MRTTWLRAWFSPEGGQRLVLCGSGHVLRDGKVGEKALDLLFPHVLRMADAVKPPYIGPDPPHVSIFGPLAVMALPEFRAKLADKSRLGGGHGRGDGIHSVSPVPDREGFARIAG